MITEKLLILLKAVVKEVVPSAIGPLRIAVSDLLRLEALLFFAIMPQDGLEALGRHRPTECI